MLSVAGKTGNVLDHKESRINATNHLDKGVGEAPVLPFGALVQTADTEICAGRSPSDSELIRAPTRECSLKNAARCQPVDSPRLGDPGVIVEAWLCLSPARN